MQINDITHTGREKGMCLYGCIKIHAFISQRKVLSCAHPRNTGTTSRNKEQDVLILNPVHFTKSRRRPRRRKEQVQKKNKYIFLLEKLIEEKDRKTPFN